MFDHPTCAFVYASSVHVFGLTGGIASGKSAVARVFQNDGVVVVDADVVAREVVLPGTPGLDALVEEFGEEILDAEGALDRKALAARVFADANRRNTLNAILHPLIGQKSQEHFFAIAARGQKLACYDAALLVESGLTESFRPLVVVDAPIEVRIARARARDSATANEVEARIRAQASSEAKRAAADFIIENVGTLEELEIRASEVLTQVRRRLDPSSWE